jgi:hypothetical protein
MQRNLNKAELCGPGGQRPQQNRRAAGFIRFLRTIQRFAISEMDQARHCMSSQAIRLHNLRIATDRTTVPLATVSNTDTPDTIVTSAPMWQLVFTVTPSPRYE